MRSSCRISPPASAAKCRAEATRDIPLRATPGEDRSVESDSQGPPRGSSGQGHSWGTGHGDVKAGAGYNFTDFSDDLTDLSYDHRGAFINLIGTM